MKEFLLWLLTIYSADHEAISREPAKACAACAAAYATLEVKKPKPKPEPTPNDGCCEECNGTGFITHGDGHKTPCPCPADCECKVKKVETKKSTEWKYVKRCINGRCFIEKVPK